MLVWKLDRQVRGVVDCIRSIQELAWAAIRLLGVTQSLDTDESNPVSRLLLHLLAAFAEFDRGTIREWVRPGLRTARANGKALGEVSLSSNWFSPFRSRVSRANRAF